MQTSVFNVKEIDNTNSAINLKDAVISLTGVSNVSIDIDSSKLTVTFDPASTNLSEIKSKITETGYYIH